LGYPDNNWFRRFSPCSECAPHFRYSLVLFQIPSPETCTRCGPVTLIFLTFFRGSIVSRHFLSQPFSLQYSYGSHPIFLYMLQAPPSPLISLQFYAHPPRLLLFLFKASSSPYEGYCHLCCPFFRIFFCPVELTTSSEAGFFETFFTLSVTSGFFVPPLRSSIFFLLFSLSFLRCYANSLEDPRTPLPPSFVPPQS